MADVRDPPMLAQSVKDRNLPPQIRLGFVRKVYGLLGFMLVISFGLAAPFVFKPEQAIDFMNANPWITGLVTAVLLLHQCVNIAMCFESFCGGGPCQRTYLRMFMTWPWNYMFLISYAVCMGVLLGIICSTYKAESVILVFLMTAGIMGALTVYAAYTTTDFSGCGMYICALCAGLCMMGLISMFVPCGSVVHRVYAALGAILCSFFIVYDTQLIFGSASFELNRSAVRKIEFTIDMYAFAAYQLYLDFVNMFLYLLELLGERRR